MNFIYLFDKQGVCYACNFLQWVTSDTLRNSSLLLAYSGNNHYNTIPFNFKQNFTAKKAN